MRRLVKHRKKDSIVSIIVFVILSIAIATILWLTIFSRLGTDSRFFYPPFWSYKAILTGNRMVFLEDLGNIALFFPVGVAATLFFASGVKNSLIIGFVFSLLIECCQWEFWLGSFEVDDLLHNTIGAGLGAFTTRIILGNKIVFENRKKSLITLLLSVSLIIAFFFGYQSLKWREMAQMAYLNNREDGTENLLVLNPHPKYLGRTGFDIIYNTDGSIIIEGQSKNRAWIEIGRVTLKPGQYSFSGLSGAAEKTVAIELEYYDEMKENYYRLTPDVGTIENSLFKLESNTKVRALVGIYPGAEGRYIARPVIYREEF